jgi:hypothetical protein
MAYLVFADTQSNAEKPEGAFFPMRGQTKRIKKVTLQSKK